MRNETEMRPVKRGGFAAFAEIAFGALSAGALATFLFAPPPGLERVGLVVTIWGSLILSNLWALRRTVLEASSKTEVTVDGFPAEDALRVELVRHSDRRIRLLELMTADDPTVRKLARAELAAMDKNELDAFERRA